MWKYLKAAFANRWNLLALFGGASFGVLSGRPDIVLPLVMAGEVAYLGMLGAHPRFQKFVDAQTASLTRKAVAQHAGRAVQQILQTLPQSSLSRFERLRARCYELRQIADDLKHAPASSVGAPLESIQLAGLDRLLWIFLRLLFTHYSLTKFLERTSIERIRDDIEDLESRLAKVGTGDSPHTQKIRRTLEDHLQTCRDRLANFDKAQANHELVGLEIDRLENKIKSLAEMAVNRQEPDFISGQVDQVATSMVETERTMNDLQFATGLAPLDEDVPELLSSPPVQIVR